MRSGEPCAVGRVAGEQDDLAVSEAFDGGVCRACEALFCFGPEQAAEAQILFICEPDRGGDGMLC